MYVAVLACLLAATQDSLKPWKFLNKPPAYDADVWWDRKYSRSPTSGYRPTHRIPGGDNKTSKALNWRGSREWKVILCFVAEPWAKFERIRSLVKGSSFQDKLLTEIEKFRNLLVPEILSNHPHFKPYFTDQLVGIFSLLIPKGTISNLTIQ